AGAPGSWTSGRSEERRVGKECRSGWERNVEQKKPGPLAELMEPFVTMIPYLLVECDGSDGERFRHTLEPYTYERVTQGVPQCISGDCGVFTLKYIFFFQAEDGIRAFHVTGVQTCALPIWAGAPGSWTSG